MNALEQSQDANAGSLHPVVSTPVTDTEKALNYYRSAVERKRPDYVPARILLHNSVRSDFPLFSAEGRGYYADPREHNCESNQYGAISVTAANGKMLGVKLGEFEVVAWRANAELSESLAENQTPKP